jgi:hypothetical protein
MAAPNSRNQCVPKDEPLRAASKAGSRSGGPGVADQRPGSQISLGREGRSRRARRNRKPSRRFRVAATVLTVQAHLFIRHVMRARRSPRPARLAADGVEIGWRQALEQALGRVRLDRSPPASIAPRQIPPATRRHGTRHQIKAAGAGRVAAAQPRQGHPTAGPQPKSCDRLVGIIRTRRQMSAMHADQR